MKKTRRAWRTLTPDQVKARREMQRVLMISLANWSVATVTINMLALIDASREVGYLPDPSANKQPSKDHAELWFRHSMIKALRAALQAGEDIDDIRKKVPKMIGGAACRSAEFTDIAVGGFPSLDSTTMH